MKLLLIPIVLIISQCVQMNQNLGMSDLPFGIEKEWDWISQGIKARMRVVGP